MAIILMILGFVWWWPLGLAILAAFIASRVMGCRHRPQFAGDGPMNAWGDGEGKWQRGTAYAHEQQGPSGGGIGRARGCRPGRWRNETRNQTTSGSHAFDDYRTETLRRLEDEEREFKEFLVRLRFAKDRAEFDQFMNERRDAPHREDPQPPA
jgi:hypothetical protein